MSVRWRAACAAALRTGVGAYLLFAAGAKVLVIDAGGAGPAYGVSLFASVLERQQVVPASSAPGVALGVILLELAVGAWLLTHVRARHAAAAAITLLVVFAGYLLLAYRQVGNADCGCLGKISSASLGSALLRNAVLGLALVPTFPRDEQSVGELGAPARS